MQSPRAIEGQSATEPYRSPGLINSVYRGGTLDLAESNHLSNVTQVVSSRGRTGKEPAISLPLHGALLPCSLVGIVNFFCNEHRRSHLKV